MAAGDPRAWISCDETATEMLARLQASRPAVVVPPLHRVPLRAGNVVEIAGSSPSAKSQVLLQAVVHCVLPKEWKGVHFGGLGRAVMYFDLDCRFDVLRLTMILKNRIMQAFGSAKNASWGSNEGAQNLDSPLGNCGSFDDELFFACMRRFLYVRCYSTLEFLAALKTMHHHSQKESEVLGTSFHFLMIDSVGAYYWIDRAYQPLQLGDNRRNTLSLQSLTEAIVDEIRRVLQVQPMLVLATKATIFGAETLSDKNRGGKWSLQDETPWRSLTGETGKYLYREYMPLAWQSFITHRVLLRESDGTAEDNDHGRFPTYTSQWVLPPLNHFDKFAVRDDGIFML